MSRSADNGAVFVFVSKRHQSDCVQADCGVFRCAYCNRLWGWCFGGDDDQCDECWASDLAEAS